MGGACSNQNTVAGAEIADCQLIPIETEAPIEVMSVNAGSTEKWGIKIFAVVGNGFNRFTINIASAHTIDIDCSIYGWIENTQLSDISRP